MNDAIWIDEPVERIKNYYVRVIRRMQERMDNDAIIEQVLEAESEGTGELGAKLFRTKIYHQVTGCSLALSLEWVKTHFEDDGKGDPIWKVEPSYCFRCGQDWIVHEDDGSCVRD